jgi:hypothetical protein
MFAMLTGATMSLLVRTAILTRLFTPTASPTTSRASLRRAIRRPHPLSVHPIHDLVEFFDDAIETAGGVSCLGGMLMHRPLLGCPHIMNPARNNGEHRHTSRDRQPFQ